MDKCDGCLMEDIIILKFRLLHDINTGGIILYLIAGMFVILMLDRLIKVRRAAGHYTSGCGVVLESVTNLA